MLDVRGKAHVRREDDLGLIHSFRLAKGASTRVLHALTRPYLIHPLLEAPEKYLQMYVRLTLSKFSTTLRCAPHVEIDIAEGVTTFHRIPSIDYLKLTACEGGIYCITHLPPPGVPKESVSSVQPLSPSPLDPLEAC